MQEQVQNKTPAKSKLGKGIASLIRGPSSDILKERMGLDSAPPMPAATTRAPEVENPPLAPVNAPVAPAPVAPANTANGLLEISLNEIIENDFQPRKIFKERELEELALSIKENGIIQPLIVTKLGDGYRLIAGERRLRAAKRAGLTKVPVVVKNTTNRDRLVLALIENVQRADLNCVEEALAYYQLMEEFQLTQEEVSKRVGKDRSTVANFLRILKLPRKVIDFLQKEQLSFGHAKILAAIKEEEKIARLAQEVVDQQLSVRELEELLKKQQRPTKEANHFFDSKLEELKNQLEGRTGFHFQLKTTPKGGGTVQIKFSNEAEFNDIYAFLMRGKN